MTLQKRTHGESTLIFWLELYCKNWVVLASSISTKVTTSINHLYPLWSCMQGTVISSSHKQREKLISLKFKDLILIEHSYW